MNKVSEIISKPIYTIYEGTKIGTVINFLYDNSQKKIKGFFIFDDDSENQEQFVNARNIYKIGEDYILVKNKNKAQIAVYENKNIMNLKAISVNGENAGEIVDLYFNEKFKAESIETNKGIILPASSIINIGKDIVIFDNNEKKINVYKMKPVAKILTENIPNIKVSILDEKAISTIPIISRNFDENNFSEDKKIISQPIKEKTKKNVSLPPKILANPKSIIGKYAKEMICGINGEIIIKKGQMITERIYEKAQKHSKLFELTNNVN